MSDPNDIRTNDGEEPFEPGRLLQDLKGLPKVSAPMDFSYHLAEAIREIESKEALPWWKRFFRPASDGGFRIPAFAYGAAAAMVVLVVSVYVISVTDFQREMQKEITPQAPAGTEIQESGEEVGQPSAVDELEHDNSSPAAKRRSEERTAPAGKVQDASDELPAAAPADRSMFEAKEKSVKKTGRSNVPSVPIAAPQSKTEQQLEFRTRGLLDAEGSFPEQDSLVADSLRKLDSLRRLQKESPAKPMNDPR